VTGGLTLGACSNSNAPASATELLSVEPAGGATAVSVNDSVVAKFSGPMMAGMLQYMDMHLGSITGPLVAMHCSWSPAFTTITCMPNAPLAPQTQYAIHIGCGMMDQAGAVVDLNHEGPGMGGQWLTSGMMGGMHGGQPIGMMGPGWTHGGYFGMEFSFTTS
jgi:hypothetical protein